MKHESMIIWMINGRGASASAFSIFKETPHLPPAYNGGNKRSE